MNHNKIKVLIIDDSAVVRDLLEKGLSMDPEIEVVGKASDVYTARDKIVYLKPDVLTLDVEMPKMDGLEFLKRLMPQYPLPVVMVSSMTSEGAKVTLESLEAGAVDFVLKPAANVREGLKNMLQELIQKVKNASKIDVSRFKNRKPLEMKKVLPKILEGTTDKIIAIGASTGGTVALRKIVEEFPPDLPGTVIVQHMPAGFTKMFARSLNEIAKVEVKEAEDNDRVVTGRVLIAPGNYHMEVMRSGGQYRVKLNQNPLVNGHRPSVDVLFSSLAESVGMNAVGVILTGMGRDGAAGLLEMRNAGARTLAQDEESSVVFGMPKEAYKNGGAEKLVGLSEIPFSILQFLKKNEGKK
ncbi:MAG TPA: chemotaxis response regulator protein-glutamate methylesterase [Spirochaetia bacterium]|nr:MAG: chemotaxis response regulator protein-glutamate methylesterase [Spirochaetes bacterium GWB1_36_13]HCL57291.1 chemotaxis response regulator protein-glutamate methylesterase [Spirochaetia bacterium]